jgi:hypothetical protein
MADKPSTDDLHLLAYVKQAEMSEWMKAQVDFLGFQGTTVLDTEYNEDQGLDTEKPVLPKK